MSPIYCSKVEERKGHEVSAKGFACVLESHDNTCIGSPWLRYTGCYLVCPHCSLIRFLSGFIMNVNVVFLRLIMNFDDELNYKW